MILLSTLFSLIFQGQPGKLLTPPAPCPYRRTRTTSRSRIHRRDRRKWICIRLLLGKPQGPIPLRQSHHSPFR
jgi:hypothetical protein